MRVSQLLKFSILLVCAALLCLASYQMVIRTNVRAVEVSVIATDSKGLPVSGLGASDFRVFDNGKEQTVASFEKISSRAAPGQAALPPNTYSNRVGDAGAGQLGKEKQPQVLSMILLDAVNTKYRNQTVVRRAVADILEQIDPAERVAIYVFGDRFRVIHDFSSDRASLLAKLKAYHGEATSGDDLLEELELDVFNQPLVPPDPVQKKYFDQNRIVDTLGALEAIANYVKGMPGRKNLLWLSAAFPLEVGTAQRTIAPAIGFSGPPDQWRSFGPEMARTMAALNDANVSVYPIDARGLSQATPESRGRKTDDASINISTMNSIAAETGGVAYANRSDLARGVRLALDDSREVCVMTYYPKAIAEDGAYHQIRVQSTRPGVQLRFRRGYYATAGEEESGAGAADRLARALSSPLDSSEIGIQASVEPASDDAGVLAVAIHVDPADLSLAHDADRWTGSLLVQWLQTGATGERYEGPSRTVPVDLTQEGYQKAMEQGVRLELRIHRDPASVALRIAVADERGGRVGSLSARLPPKAAQPAASSGK